MHCHNVRTQISTQGTVAILRTMYICEQNGALIYIQVNKSAGSGRVLHLGPLTCQNVLNLLKFDGEFRAQLGWYILLRKRLRV